MTPLSELELAISVAAAEGDAKHGAQTLVSIGETVLEHWIIGRGEQPTLDEKEGFRLLALHRQGAKGSPSFNACRETCRELVYHYNLIEREANEDQQRAKLQMMALVAMHLYLFVSGKMEVEGLGEFCCSSKPLHAAE
ncbi:hypothetical protein L2D14_13770 [Thalassospiraceae bacterium LMO-JJ14]|nr:hypothetical protein L2D14_13770 [Thalassospiraceae bacterium LMO-JJ14]